MFLERQLLTSGSMRLQCLLGALDDITWKRKKIYKHFWDERWTQPWPLDQVTLRGENLEEKFACYMKWEGSSEWWLLSHVTTVEFVYSLTIAFCFRQFHLRFKSDLHSCLQLVLMEDQTWEASKLRITAMRIAGYNTSDIPQGHFQLFFSSNSRWVLPPSFLPLKSCSAAGSPDSDIAQKRNVELM